MSDFPFPVKFTHSHVRMTYGHTAGSAHLHLFSFTSHFTSHTLKISVLITNEKESIYLVRQTFSKRTHKYKCHQKCIKLTFVRINVRLWVCEDTFYEVWKFFCSQKKACSFCLLANRLINMYVTKGRVKVHDIIMDSLLCHRLYICCCCCLDFCKTWNPKH